MGKKSRKKSEETYCITKKWQSWVYGRTIKSIRYFFTLKTGDIELAKVLRDKINALFDRDGIIYNINADNVNNGNFEPCKGTAILGKKKREEQANKTEYCYKETTTDKTVPFSVSTWLFFIHDKEIVL